MKSEEMYEYVYPIPYNGEPLYIYEGHLGNLFTSDCKLDFNETHCEQCGDSDWYIGEASNRTEAWGLLESHIDMFDPSQCDSCSHKKNEDYCYEECKIFLSGGGFDYDYVKEFIESHWEI